MNTKPRIMHFMPFTHAKESFAFHSFPKSLQDLDTVVFHLSRTEWARGKRKIHASVMKQHDFEASG